MERVPSWLMWNLPLSVIWMPSCCTKERQKTCQGLGSFPPSSLQPVPQTADGCDELMWPPDVSIALAEKPESHSRTSAPARTHCAEVPCSAPSPWSSSRNPMHFSADGLIGESAVPRCCHINKTKCLQFWDSLKLLDFCWP